MYPILITKLICYSVTSDIYVYSKTCLKQPLKRRPKIGFQDQVSLTTGQKYCRMLQRKHFAILSTFVKLPFVIKIFVLSILELPFYTSFTVHVFTFYRPLDLYKSVLSKAKFLISQPKHVLWVLERTISMRRFF